MFGSEYVGLNKASTSYAGASMSRPQEYELFNVASACEDLKERAIVTDCSISQIWKECAKWVEHMRTMITGYDKGRGLRGNEAFREFLENRDSCWVIGEKLGTVRPGKP